MSATGRRARSTPEANRPRATSSPCRSGVTEAHICPLVDARTRELLVRAEWGAGAHEVAVAVAAVDATHWHTVLRLSKRHDWVRGLFARVRLIPRVAQQHRRGVGCVLQERGLRVDLGADGDHRV